MWLDQRQKLRQLGFLFGERPVRSCISWKSYVDDVVVGSRVFCCSCSFVFLRACYPVLISLVSGADSAVHTWVDVELRVVGQQVAVNIKNPNRSCVHNRVGVRSKSRLFFPGLVFLKVDWVPFGVLCWSSGQNQDAGTPRTIRSGSSPGGHGGVGVSGISSVRHSGLIHSLPCSPVAQRGCLFARNEWFLMIRRIRGKSLATVGIVEVDLVVSEILGCAKKEQFVFLFVLFSISEDTSWKTSES